MATGGKGSNGRAREEREARERVRLYQARTSLYAAQQRRRVRDNVIAGVVAGVLILGVLGGQLAFYTLGPGAPAPSPSASPSPGASDTPSASPSPDVSASPSPSSTP